MRDLRLQGVEVLLHRSQCGEHLALLLQFPFAFGLTTVRFFGGIVDIQVAQVSARLTDRRITLDVTDSAREWLANTGYDPAYGARPLRRLVQTEVGDQLARMLLAGEVDDGDTVLVDQTGGDHLELSAWAADQLEDMGEEKTDDSADVPNPAE